LRSKTEETDRALTGMDDPLVAPSVAHIELQRKDRTRSGGMVPDDHGNSRGRPLPVIGAVFPLPHVRKAVR
ncbi:MAG: hypothetical protein ACYDDZ_13815, partial [Acidimicrobiales bacterium]